VVGFDQSAVSPLNVTIPADPVAGTPARQVMGGLLYAGQNGAPTSVGSPPSVKLSPRLGAAFSLNQRTVIRAGYGLFWAPWSSGFEASTGYSATTNLQQNVNRPITSITNPFPSGLAPISGNANGLLTGVSSSISFIDPARGAPRVHQYSADIQRELPGDMSVGLTYMGARGQNLTFGASVNINQVDPRFIGLNNVNGTNALTQTVPNPFAGNPNAGAFGTRGPTIQRNQLLRPYPQFDNITMTQSTLASSEYHAAVVSLTKRATGWWGGRINYTWSRLYDNQFGQGNYYSNAPGILNNYTAIEGSPYFDLDAEWGRSRLDSPHKVTASPIIRLPFGEGRQWLTSGAGNLIAGGWTVAMVIQVQSGFPLGVSANVNNTNLLGSAQRPNVVPGVEQRTPGSITDRLRDNPADDLYLNSSAFTAAPIGTFGDAPRLLDGAYSPWRSSTDLAINKDFPFGGSRRAQLRLEVINLFDNPWYAALASTAVGNTNFGRVTAQANYSRTMQVTFRMTF
jgi:hypothetical protein